MDDLNFERGSAANNEYVAALYDYYLETMPDLIDDLEQSMLEGDPALLQRLLAMISANSKLVSALRVVRSARQLNMLLERMPFVSRTFLGLEIARLRMEYLAAKSEIEFMLQALA